MILVNILLVLKLDLYIDSDIVHQLFMQKSLGCLINTTFLFDYICSDLGLNLLALWAIDIERSNLIHFKIIPLGSCHKFTYAMYLNLLLYLLLN